MKVKRNWTVTVPASVAREPDWTTTVRCHGEAKARLLALAELKRLRPGLLRLPNGTRVERS